MNSPSEDIKDILEQSSVGTLATDLFISKEPDSPDACVTIFDTSGQDPATWANLDYPSVQVKVRGERYEYLNAWAKGKEVKDALHGLTNETWNGTRYIQIVQEGDIFFLGYDGKQRPLLTLNFSIQRTA